LDSGIVPVPGTEEFPKIPEGIMESGNDDEYKEISSSEDLIEPKLEPEAEYRNRLTEQRPARFWPEF
jgi:hypothetical protein